MSFNCFAQELPTYLEEMQSLGAVAGQGLACQASKYETFEMIARALLVTKATSDEEQEAGMRAYNEYKANAFVSKLEENLSGCNRIASQFDSQKIFKSVIYGDGSIKLPDGKIIEPRQAYDVTLVYQKDPEARNKYIALYQKFKDQIKQNPEYQKALREQQMRESY